MCKMFEMADWWLVLANESLREYEKTQDIYKLDTTAFLLQQVIEFYLKGVLNVWDEEIVHTHKLKPNIELLLNLYLDGTEKAIPILEDIKEIYGSYIKEHAAEIEAWESEARCDSDCYIDYYGVKETLNITKTIQKKIKLLLNSDNE